MRSITLSLPLLAVMLLACAPPETEAVDDDDEDRDLEVHHESLDATGRGATVVRQLYLYGVSRELFAQSFRTPYTKNPQWTPDGGVYQYFFGDTGVGAIYAHQQTNGAWIGMPIYGAMLEFWAAHGWETFLGYPSTEEYDAEDWSSDTPCRTQGGVRQQRFGLVRWSDPNAGRGGDADVILCWAPDRGVWVLPQEVADGLAGKYSLERLQD